MKMYGAWRKIAEVDLYSREVKIKDVDEDLYRTYFSGSGLAAYLLYQRKKYAVDPLGPENDLVFMTGLLTGALFMPAQRPRSVRRLP